MLAKYLLKKEIEALEDYINRLERYLDTHTRRLNFLIGISDSLETYCQRSSTLRSLQRDVNRELDLEKEYLARLKYQLADLAA